MRKVIFITKAPDSEVRAIISSLQGLENDGVIHESRSVRGGAGQEVFIRDFMAV